MSTVSGIGLLTQPTSQQAASGAGQSTTKDVGKSEFLKLLITQLQNQDPMNPVDNQQFIAQLASFSSLEQLISINQSVTKLASAFAETRSASTSA
jgi:flagellar basal-body rod modification protein FlgD